MKTYLVGPERSYRRYMEEHGYASDCEHAVNVRAAKQLEGVREGQVIFLHDFRDLKEWREIYDIVIADRTVRRQVADLAKLREMTRWASHVYS